MPAGPGVEATVSVGGDSELREQLIAELQSFETNLAYSLNGEVIPEFDWRKVKEEFLGDVPPDVEFGVAVAPWPA